MSLFTEEEKKLLFKFGKIVDPMFRARLPCLTISVMSEDVDFIKMIPTHILEVIVTSKRILSCVPARNLETLLSQQVGLSRVSLFSLMNAFTKMPRDKLSLKMMRLIIMEQVTWKLVRA